MYKLWCLTQTLSEWSVRVWLAADIQWSDCESKQFSVHQGAKVPTCNRNVSMMWLQFWMNRNVGVSIGQLEIHVSLT